MNCPNCNVLVSIHTGKVLESRPTSLTRAKFLENGDQIDSTRRRRLCLQCRHTWTTYEINEENLSQMQTIGTAQPEAKKVIEAYSAAIEVLETAMVAALEVDKQDKF